MGGEATSPPQEHAAHQVLATSSTLGHLLLLAQSDVLMKCWCCPWVDIVMSRVSVWNEHGKEQGISQVEDFIGMAVLEGRVVVYACKLLLEGCLRCVSRIPQSPACWAIFTHLLKMGV